jgi:hypothetical protein
MTDEFFDPIKRQEVLIFLRTELAKLKAEIDILAAVAEYTHVTVDLAAHRAVAARVESRIATLESRYTTVN